MTEVTQDDLDIISAIDILGSLLLIEGPQASPRENELLARLHQLKEMKVIRFEGRIAGRVGIIRFGVAPLGQRLLGGDVAPKADATDPVLTPEIIAIAQAQRAEKDEEESQPLRDRMAHYAEIERRRLSERASR